MNLLPTLFIPHGGGPCFFIDPPAHDPHMWEGLASYLRGIDASLGARPKAVLVISGHWETERPTVNVAERPSLLFDYYGFPEHTYRLKYPVAGAPDLEPRVRALLAEAGFDLGLESKRGLDHGVFVPFLLIYPHADVPIMQLSLHHSLDPGLHLAIGRALAPLRRAGSAHRRQRHELSQSRGDVFGRRCRSRRRLRRLARRGGRRSHVARRAADGMAQRAGRTRIASALRASHSADGRRRCRRRRAGVRTFNESIAGKPISGFRFG